VTGIALNQPATAGFFTPEKRRTIRLYGKLGTQFGRVHHFVCNDAAGAVHALCQMIPGFRRHLYESKDRGVGYAVFIGKQNIGVDMLNAPAGNEDIRIAPIIMGSGRGGLFQIALGAALIIAAPYAAGWLMGTSFVGAAVAVATFAPMIGWSMVLGGVSQMLVKQPQGLTGVESPDNGASYNFNGPVNMTAQGNPVPVLYGEMTVGSLTVSGDMYSEDKQ